MKPHTLLIILAVSLFLVLDSASSRLLAAPNPTVLAEPDAPNDEPALIVSEEVRNWVQGGGLLYWNNDCSAIEGDNTPGHLRRMPSSSGVVRTLAKATGCNWFRNMNADNQGLYFSRGGSVYRYAADGRDTQPTKILDSGMSIYGLSIVGDYIYLAGVISFPSRIHQIMRAKRDGSDVVLLVTSALSINGLAMNDSSIYWIDSEGLKGINHNCSPLPCTAVALLVSTERASKVKVLLGPLLVLAETGSDTLPAKIDLYLCLDAQECFFNHTVYTGPIYRYTRFSNLVWQYDRLYWIESTNTGTRLLRQFLSANTPDELVSNEIYGQVLHVDNQYLYFSGRTGIYKLSLNATAIRREVVADAIEITQGIQNLANEVPLTANKTTYVRAYGRQTDGASTSVTAWLYGTQNGSPLPNSPLHPLKPTQSLVSGGSYDRGKREDGWLFLLPDAWLNGTVTLKVVVDPENRIGDVVRTNNAIEQTVNFVTKAPICPIFIPVQTNAPLPSANAAYFWPTIDYTERLYPSHDLWVYKQDNALQELEVCWWGPFPYPCFSAFELPDDTGHLFFMLGVRDFFSNEPSACRGNGHYIGMVHPGTSTSNYLGIGIAPDPIFNDVFAKYAWVKFPRSITLPSDSPFGVREMTTLAHEMGHNWGRKHVNCGGPDAVDSNYPYPTEQIANIGTTSHYGFDIRTHRPIAPNSAADFMSYCDPAWTSDYTWKAIQGRMDAVVEQRANSAYTSDFASADGAVLLTGVVTPAQNSGYLGYGWNFPTTALNQDLLEKWQRLANYNSVAISSSNGPVAVTYRIRLFDAAERILAEQPIRLVNPHVHSRDLPADFFITTFPAPTGNPARLELLQDATVIATRTFGSNIPAITVNSPSAGQNVGEQLTIEWQASDADTSDILFYNVQYSPDNGQQWYSLVSDFPGAPGSPTQILSFAALNIPGSLPNSALIRVAASDGYNTALVTSQPFTVGNRKPQPYILAPTAIETIPAGEAIVLRGDATDPEDGGLTGESLRWAVGNQQVAMGEEAFIEGLAPGGHLVTLTAQDGLSNAATISSTLRILPLDIPTHWDTIINGDCVAPNYMHGVQLRLNPYPDGSQAILQAFRSPDYLSLCFSGLKRSVNGNSYVGLRIDVNNSRDSVAMSNDYGFFISEDGGFFTRSGNGTGSFAEAGPFGLRAQVSADGDSWSAELQIDANVLGGWEHTAGMSFGHYSVFGEGDEFSWPYASQWNNPSTWALTGLGHLPRLQQIMPDTVVAGSPELRLVVSGTNLMTTTEFFLDGVAINANWGSSNHLTVTVPAAHLTQGRIAFLLARNPGGLVSNQMTFVITNPPPVINNVNPTQTIAAGGSFTLQVTGENYISGAKVLWNGIGLPTTYNSASQLIAEVDATKITRGQVAGITILNPEPDTQTSNTLPFVVQPQAAIYRSYLPFIKR